MLLGLQLTVMLYMTGHGGFNELKLVDWSMEMEEPNGEIDEKDKSYCKAVTDLQGNVNGSSCGTTSSQDEYYKEFEVHMEKYGNKDTEEWRSMT